MSRRSSALPCRPVRRLRRAAAAAEFAITLPVIVLLLLGTMEYGNYFSDLSMVNVCTRNGARVGGTQYTKADARVQGAVATRTLLGDLGFDCQVGSDSCTVTTSVIQQAQVDLLEVQVEVAYTQLTNALPNTGAVPLIPSLMHARAVYPIIGN